MNDQKLKIIEFAKRLYLEVNHDGKKTHTWDNISKNILKKYKLEIHFTTIQKWSKRYDWENLFEKLKMAGIEKGKQQLQEKENKLIDEKSQLVADIYKSNKTLQNLSQRTLTARLLGKPVVDSQGNEIDANFGNTDLIRILQHSESTLLELQDKKKTLDGTSTLQLPNITLQIREYEED
jgi:ribosomal protein S24E